jgi:hypothetical protein
VAFKEPQLTVALQRDPYREKGPLTTIDSPKDDFRTFFHFGNGFQLFLISFVILFLELAAIRWFPAHVLYLTFFYQRRAAGLLFWGCRWAVWLPTTGAITCRGHRSCLLLL